MVSPCWSNHETKAVSAYTMSKIALIKMVELLDAEMPDVRFVSVGPGWVKTKIHEEMIKAGPVGGDGYSATVRKLQDADPNAWTEMTSVVECCDWLIAADRSAIGGRNFSVANDEWRRPTLAVALRQDHNMYKLRRHNNNWRET